MLAPLLALALVGPASADRPTDTSGLYSFDSTDVVESWDSPEGRVRVHYSVDGPNQTILSDLDEDGVPDFVALIGLTAEEVLDHFEAAGFQAVPAESEVGLGELGGSDAFDIYLVDFDGVGDGHFQVDGCKGSRCAGHARIDNNLPGYSDRETAVAVLTSHELFHGVQAGIVQELPAWLSEGTATWGELSFDPDSTDFRSFCDRYLDETGRSLDRPPAGTTGPWSYGTALFFAFMEIRLGEGALEELLVALDGRTDEPAQVIAEIFAARGDSLEEAWITFATWNLATGKAAGMAESYSFADDLDGIVAEDKGSAIEDDHRFYPLAASYWKLSHAGGPLFLTIVDDPTGLSFSVHPVTGGGETGPVEEALWSGRPTAPGEVDLGDVPAGSVWLVGSNPQLAENSTKALFCFGDEDAVAPCREQLGGGDTGEQEDTGTPDEEPGCGCASAGSGARGSETGWLLALLSLGLVHRRRRGSPARPASPREC